MANDYAAINNGINQLIAIGQNDVVLNYVDPTTYVDLVQLNQIGFGQPIGAQPVNAGNLNQLNQVNARLIPQAAANALHRLQPLGDIGMGQKIVFQYTCGEYGFSELWYSSAADPITRDQIVNYVNARLDMSGVQTTFVRARSSTTGTAGSYRTYSAANLLQGNNVLNGKTGRIVGGAGRAAALAPSDIANTSMNIDCRSTAPAVRMRRMYLRGLPDSIVERGGEFVDTIGWTQWFTAWATVVKGFGWGWYGQPSPKPQRYVITALTSANGAISITANGNIYPAPVDGQFPNTPVRITGLPNPFAYLNGAMVVKPVSQTVAGSIRQMPFPAGATFAAGPGKIYLQNPSQFYAAAEIELGNPGHRDAGNFLPRHRGRQKNRVWS